MAHRFHAARHPRSTRWRAARSARQPAAVRWRTAFVARVGERLHALGLAPLLALTPTRLASLWFARLGDEVALAQHGGLASRLAALPLACTRWPEESPGPRCDGRACHRRLPEAAARWFHPPFRAADAAELDRALGTLPIRVSPSCRANDTRRDATSSPRSPIPLASAGCEPLLDELCAFLEHRCCEVDVARLSLLHRDAPPTRLCLRFAEPHGRRADCRAAARAACPHRVA